MNRSTRKSVTRYNAETILYGNRISEVGNISPASLLLADAFVTACKRTGVWDQLIEVGLFVGDDLASARVKIKYGEGAGDTLGNTGFTDAHYAESGANGGLLGANGRHLDTNFALFDSGAAGFAFYNRTAGVLASDKTMMGADDFNEGVCALMHSDDRATFLWGSVDGAERPDGSTRAGLYLGVAPTDLIRKIYFQGTLAGAVNFGAPADPGPPDYSAYLFARNVLFAPQDFWTGRGSFYAITAVLTAAQVNDLNAAVVTLQAALNRL